MPVLPDESRMVRADVDVVAVPATVVVARYRFPPALRKAHCALPAPADSTSCGAVAEKELSCHCGVVVPMPNASVDWL